MLGGLAESPAKNYPNSYVGQMELFKTYPYLFPCMLASIPLFIGGQYSCLLLPSRLEILTRPLP